MYVTPSLSLAMSRKHPIRSVYGWPRQGLFNFDPVADKYWWLGL
jgi:hypothetical protein